jgi:flagellin
MPQIINTNIASLNAQRNLNNSQSAQTQALERLSSGLRINGAKDDAAGLAISNRLDAQVRGLNVANRNAGDGVSLAQTAEGALNSITGSLQRMRELALQSSNGSNTALERSSLQEEVEQLKAEIKTISEKTNFNGQNLLDGSFQNTSFQTGANVGEKIDISISKTTDATLGTSLANGISTSTAGSSTAMAAGDVTINGAAVGATNAADDGASIASADTSAIANAAAINRVSEASGVTAVVDANSVAGVSATGGVVAAAAASVTINGTGITLSGTGVAANLGADLQGVADTINGFNGQTGVIASIDNNNLAGGITLTADDGRNVVIGAGGAAYGLSAAATYSGTVTLVSNDGSDIEIGSNTGLSQEALGLEVGTYSGSNSGVNGSTVTSVALVSGDLTINGVSVGASLAADDTASTATKDQSAISKAAAINRVSEQTGVTAQAQNTQILSGAVNLTAVASLTINGVSISDTATAGTIGEKMANLVSNINQKNAQTGVIAKVVDGDQYELIAADGRNVVVGGTVTNSGLTAGTTQGSITLQSGGEIEIGSANAGAAAQVSLRAGFKAGTYGGGETGTLVKNIDVSTKEGAESAITGIDNAINQVAREQAKLGAIQNRFESTIANNSVNSESLSAANSRIRDADFAVETAALSRSQVLQQAGISVLAQANARPQQVLSLLQ